MELSQLNYHHLFYFWSVARTGHLTNASRALHTSQSALSAQIKQLEERLNHPLFERKGRRLELTEVGQLVFAYSEDIFGLGQELISRVEGRSEGMVRLRVGSVATLSRNYQENWIRPLLTDPCLVLTMESGSLDALVDRLIQHQLDVILANEPVSSSPDRHLICLFLGSQSLGLVSKPDAWSKGELRIPEDLDGVDMAVPGVRHAARGQFDALCSAAGVKPRLRAEVDDMAMMRLIARDSGWLTLLPDVVVQDELSSGMLLKVGESPQLQEHFYAITSPRRYRLEALDQLLSRSGAVSAL